MTTQSTQISSGGIGGALLANVFIILKLTGTITWSWIWVLSPLWIPLSVAVLVAAVILVVVLAKS